MTQQDYKVANIDLAEFGRKEISLAESEMPALMALRRKYTPAPTLGAKLEMTPERFGSFWLFRYNRL